MVRFIRSALRVLLGYVLACLTAGVVTTAFVHPLAEVVPVPSEPFLDLALLAAAHSAMFGFPFMLIAAAIGEWFAIRSLMFYLFVGCAIAALGFFTQFASEVTGQATILNRFAVTAFLTTGFCAAFIYWLVAGQFAGRREREKLIDMASILDDEAAPKTSRTSLARRLLKAREENPSVGLVYPAPTTVSASAPSPRAQDGFPDDDMPALLKKGRADRDE